MNHQSYFRQALLITAADGLVLSEAGADAALEDAALLLSKRIFMLALDPSVPDAQALSKIRELSRELLPELRARGF